MSDLSPPRENHRLSTPKKSTHARSNSFTSSRSPSPFPLDVATANSARHRHATAPSLTPNLDVNNTSFPSSPPIEHAMEGGGLWGHKVHNSSDWSGTVEKRFRELNATRKWADATGTHGLGIESTESDAEGGGRRKSASRIFPTRNTFMHPDPHPLQLLSTHRRSVWRNVPIVRQILRSSRLPDVLKDLLAVVFLVCFVFSASSFVLSLFPQTTLFSSTWFKSDDIQDAYSYRVPKWRNDRTADILLKDAKGVTRSRRKEKARLDTDDYNTKSFGGTEGNGQWVWKNPREELGALMRYLITSDASVLPPLNPLEPLDPNLVLDFNLLRLSPKEGRQLVEQAVNEFWTSEGDLSGGAVMVLGLGDSRRGGAKTLMFLLDSLLIDTSNVYLDVSDRPDVEYLQPLLARIGNVPDLPMLVIGGHPIGDYFAVRALQQTGEFDRLLKEANIVLPSPPPQVSSAAAHDGLDTEGGEDEGTEYEEEEFYEDDEIEEGRSLGIGISVGIEVDEDKIDPLWIHS
ncbi:Thioredoxin-like fold [Phaffia rhodozyma]|uniref:Thioredoxin-like fold n=1 Tax=Phaffia rhodozyma TaxID=264483 RepID=A0A0F7SK92_PHARH|nr:Thioredoxin-like fold [Phaffia rhodozyma]